MRSKELNETYFTDLCSRVFGDHIKVPATKVHHLYYGANIIVAHFIGFTYGSEDLWKGVGFTEKIDLVK